MSRFSPFVIAAAVAATSLTVVAASPSSARTPTSVTVRYGDLDLASADGRATFDRRVHNAAATVCPVTLGTMATAMACQHDAVAAAKVDVRLAAVTGSAVRVSR